MTSSRTVGPPGRRLVAVAVGAVVAVAWTAALWLVLSSVLATNRGLDMTDEGLHLLSMDGPEGQVGFQYPFGWSTAPLFWLVGYDIASVRTLAAVLLVSLSALLGWLVARLVGSTVMATGRDADTDRWVPAIVSGTSAVGSLIFYSWFFRTPDYNWANLVGVELALVGLVLMLRTPEPGRRLLGARAVLGALVAAAGILCTVPARPSTWAALLLVMAILLMAWRAWRVGVLLWLGVVAGLIAVVLLAVATGLWPTDVVSVADAAVRAPSFHPSSTISGALARELAVPLTFAESVWLLPRFAKYSILVCWLAMAVMAWRRRSPAWMVVPFSIVAAMLLWTIQVDHFLDRLAAITTAEGALIVSSLLVLLGSARFLRTWQWRPAGRVLLLAAALVLLPFAAGFGSMAEPYPIAARSSVLLLLATTTVLQLAAAARVRLLLVLAGWTLLATATTIGVAWQQPLNLAAPISEQDTSVPIGPRGSELYLDATTAAQVNDVVASAADAGWQPGTPLLGVAWQWSSTIPYVLGAAVPPFLMPTILYPNQGAQDLLAYHLAQLPCDPWSKAWVLTSTPGARGPSVGPWYDPAVPSDEPWLDLATSAVTAHLGRSLEQDYVRVATSHGLELWEPRAEAVPVTAPCQAVRP